MYIRTWGGRLGDKSLLLLAKSSEPVVSDVPPLLSSFPPYLPGGTPCARVFHTTACPPGGVPHFDWGKLFPKVQAPHLS